MPMSYKNNASYRVVHYIVTRNANNKIQIDLISCSLDSKVL